MLVAGEAPAVFGPPAGGHQRAPPIGQQHAPIRLFLKMIQAQFDQIGAAIHGAPAGGGGGTAIRTGDGDADPHGLAVLTSEGPPGNLPCRGGMP